MKNTFARTLIAGMVLFVAAVAFAADPVPRLTRDPLLGEQRFDVAASVPEGWQVALPEPATGLASGLAFDLPADAVRPSATVRVAVANGTRIHLEETIVLPSELAAAPTIRFLAHHPRQLASIRKAAAARPEAIRFQVSIDGKQIVDVPFVVADSGSDRLANGGSIAGASDSVLMRLPEPRKLRMSPCTDACDEAFFECYLYCDERGAGCPWCQTQYSDCLWYCSH